MSAFSLLGSASSLWCVTTTSGCSSTSAPRIATALSAPITTTASSSGCSTAATTTTCWLGDRG